MLDRQEASLLFRLISHRDERGSTLITTHKAIRDWPEILAGDEVMATALLDRLLHRCHVFNIRGCSYRLRELQEQLKSGAPPGDYGRLRLPPSPGWSPRRSGDPPGLLGMDRLVTDRVPELRHSWCPLTAWPFESCRMAAQAGTSLRGADRAHDPIASRPRGIHGAR